MTNATFALVPWADVCYGADHKFWQVYIRDALKVFRGELWTCSEGATREFGLYWIRCGKLAGLHPDPDTVNSGGNSGFQAISLAHKFGAARIILLGFDMQRTGGKTHHHGNHRGGLRNGAGFVSWIRQMGPLAADLKRARVEVWNASRSTALNCFPKKSVEEVLRVIESPTV